MSLEEKAEPQVGTEAPTDTLILAWWDHEQRIQQCIPEF